MTSVKKWQLKPTYNTYFIGVTVENNKAYSHLLHAFLHYMHNHKSFHHPNTGRAANESAHKMYTHLSSKHIRFE